MAETIIVELGDGSEEEWEVLAETFKMPVGAIYCGTVLTEDGEEIDLYDWYTDEDLEDENLYYEDDDEEDEDDWDYDDEDEDD